MIRQGHGKISFSPQTFKRVSVLSFFLLTMIVVACESTDAPYISETPLTLLEATSIDTPPLFTLSPNSTENDFFISPTPDPAHIAYPELSTSVQHTVLPGETLEMIAGLYGVNSEWISVYNQLENTDQVNAGLRLKIPSPELGPSFKIIPDSELVDGPVSVNFDVRAFIKSRGGYLANYGEEIDGKYLDAAEIIDLVVKRYSVNPRILIALIQHQSGWLDDLAPLSEKYPLGYEHWWSEGLYKQLTWGANELNRGYYLWRAGDVSSWRLADSSIVMIEPTINSGTAGLQNFFSKVYAKEDWDKNVGQYGFFQTYFELYGFPFDLAVEPLFPASLAQPAMQLPFSEGEIWAFTGGPHDGWDTGSPWSALDFAPPGEPQGCNPNDSWVVAVADGIITYAEGGVVLLDIDRDGFEETGWVVFYMHIENRDRISGHTQVKAGDRIGHPACEGGVATAAHVHIARKYNGEWIPATGSFPFVLDRWTVFDNASQYGGYLQRDEDRIHAWSGYGEYNQIKR